MVLIVNICVSSKLPFRLRFYLGMRWTHWARNAFKIIQGGFFVYFLCCTKIAIIAFEVWWHHLQLCYHLPWYCHHSRRIQYMIFISCSVNKSGKGFFHRWVFLFTLFLPYPSYFQCHFQSSQSKFWCNPIFAWTQAVRHRDWEGFFVISLYP